MIFGLTFSQQEQVNRAVQRKKQLEKELNFSQTTINSFPQNDNSDVLPKIPRASFSSFKSQKKDRKSIRKLHTMETIEQLPDVDTQDKKQSNCSIKLFKILENLLNC